MGMSFSEIQSAYNAAKAANETRYNQILQGYQGLESGINAGAQSQYREVVGNYKDRYNRVMGYLSNLGDSQKEDQASSYARQLAQGQQSMISRGLGNSTVLDSLNRGINSDQMRSNLQLQDSLTRERLGYDTQLSGDWLGAKRQMGAGLLATRNELGNQKLQFMERRNDAYPDLQLYGQLMGMAGAAGMGGANGNIGLPGGGGARQGAGGAIMPQMYNARGLGPASPTIGSGDNPEFMAQQLNNSLILQYDQAMGGGMRGAGAGVAGGFNFQPGGGMGGWGGAMNSGGSGAGSAFGMLGGQGTGGGGNNPWANGGPLSGNPPDNFGWQPFQGDSDVFSPPQYSGWGYQNSMGNGFGGMFNGYSGGNGWGGMFNGDGYGDMGMGGGGDYGFDLGAEAGVGVGLGGAGGGALGAMAGGLGL